MNDIFLIDSNEEEKVAKTYAVFKEEYKYVTERKRKMAYKEIKSIFTGYEYAEARTSMEQ